MATREIRLGSIKGLSSYELAVKSGTFTGTLIEYLNKEQQYYNDMVLYGDALKDELGGIDADTINAIMADAVKYEDFATYDDMEAWLKDAANIGTLRDGDLLLIEDMDVPNYWVLEALEVADEDTGYYYKIAELGDLFGEGSTEIDTSKLVSLDSVSDNKVIDRVVDLNDYLEVGQYTISTIIADQILNKPEGASAGDLFIKCTFDDNNDTGEIHRQQVYMTYDNTGIYTRYIHRDSADGDTVYGEWTKFVTEPEVKEVVQTYTAKALTLDAPNNVITEPVDLNDYLEIGQYSIDDSAVGDITNKPEGITVAGELIVNCPIATDDDLETGDAIHRQQMFITCDNTGIFMRYIHKDSADVEIVYDKWKKIVNGDDLADGNILDHNTRNTIIRGTINYSANYGYADGALMDLSKYGISGNNTVAEIVTLLPAYSTTIIEYNSVSLSDITIFNNSLPTSAAGMLYIKRLSGTNDTARAYATVHDIVNNVTYTASYINGTLSNWTKLASASDLTNLNVKVDSWDESTATLHLTSV